jgi:hypothetical protein
MKSILSVMLLLSLSMACGTFRRDRGGDERQQQVSNVDKFIQEHASKHTDDQQFLEAYRNYLNSVQEFYSRNDIQDKFDTYLSSLQENHEQLAQMRQELTGQQAEEAGRPWEGDRSVSQEERGPLGIGDEDRMQSEQERQPINRRLEKTQKMSNKYDRLTREREEQLRSELGEELFGQLKENYLSFQENYEGTKYYFPI